MLDHQWEGIEQRVRFRFPSEVLTDVGRDRLVQLNGKYFNSSSELFRNNPLNGPAVRFSIDRDASGAVTVHGHDEGTSEHVMNRHTINSLILRGVVRALEG